jgi:hypothetical protein
MSKLLKFIFEGLPVRGLLVRLTDDWQELLRRRSTVGGFAPEVQVLVGELAAAGLLMQGNIKFNGALVLQISGDGPVKVAVAEVQPDLSFRATASVHGEVPAGAQLEALVNQHPEMPELYSAACMAALVAGEPEKVLEWLKILEGADQVAPMMRWALEGTARGPARTAPRQQRHPQRRTAGRAGTGDRHRRLDRRHRCPGPDCAPLPAQYPRDRRGAAHAGRLHPDLRRTPEQPLCTRGQGGGDRGSHPDRADADRSG